MFSKNGDDMSFYLWLLYVEDGDAAKRCFAASLPKWNMRDKKHSGLFIPLKPNQFIYYPILKVGLVKPLKSPSVNIHIPCHNVNCCHLCVFCDQ